MSSQTCYHIDNHGKWNLTQTSDFISYQRCEVTVCGKTDDPHENPTSLFMPFTVCFCWPLLQLALAFPLIQLFFFFVLSASSLLSPPNLIIKSWQLKHRYERDLSFILSDLMRSSSMPLIQLRFN